MPYESMRYALCLSEHPTGLQARPGGKYLGLVPVVKGHDSNGRFQAKWCKLKRPARPV